MVLALASGARARAGYMSQTIDVPGAIGTQAEGINDSGQIVGFYRKPKFDSFWQPGLVGGLRSC